MPTPGCCSRRGREGAGGEGNGIHLSPAGISHPCPCRVPRPQCGHVVLVAVLVLSGSAPARTPAFGARGFPAPFPWSRAFPGHASSCPRPQPQNFPLAPACSPACDPSSSEKLLCGVRRGRGGGGGGGRPGCPGEGMPFNSSLLFRAGAAWGGQAPLQFLGLFQVLGGTFGVLSPSPSPPLRPSHPVNVESGRIPLDQGAKPIALPLLAALLLFFFTKSSCFFFYFPCPGRTPPAPRAGGLLLPCPQLADPIGFGSGPQIWYGVTAARCPRGGWVLFGAAWSC